MNLLIRLFGTSNKEEEIVKRYPFQSENAVGLIFVFLLGFIGVQKLAEVPFEPIRQLLCTSGLSLPLVACDATFTSTDDQIPRVDIRSKPKESIIIGMDQSPNALGLRKQFAYMPDLISALKKLKWNGGDEQDAARFLSVITAIENGRQETSGIPSSMSSILDAVWNQYPDLVATSHCLNCNRFYQQVLQPYFAAGTKTSERLNQMASGHPRFLQALSKSDQLSINDVNSIAKLQAELLSSEDANTAKFIGDILLKDNDLDSLHFWSSKGWNGSYAISDYHKLLKLPQHIIVDAWERGVVKGADNAVITRYLVSTGYRPALRWLLWVHAGNLSYFQNTAYQAEKDRYNDLILNLYIDFPTESKDDLTGFYSKHWENIHWDQANKKWVLKKTLIKSNYF